MSDFLHHLVARATGTAEQITPRPSARFEPEGRQPDADFEEQETTTTSRPVNRPHLPPGPVPGPAPQPLPPATAPRPALPRPDASITAPAAAAPPWERPEPPAPPPPGPPPVVPPPAPEPETGPGPAPAPPAGAATFTTTPAAAAVTDPAPRDDPGLTNTVTETRRVVVTTHRAVPGRAPGGAPETTPAGSGPAAAPPVPPDPRPQPPSSPAPDREPATVRRSPGPDPAPPATAPAPEPPPSPPALTPGDAAEMPAEPAEAAPVSGPPVTYRTEPSLRRDDAAGPWPTADRPRRTPAHTPPAEPAAVEIHIGRIEIRSAATPPPAARKRDERPRVMPLDEYLRRRRGGS